MSKKNHNHPAQAEARIAARITGAESKLTGAKPLDVQGDDYTQDQLVAKLQSLKVPYTASNEAHVTSSKAVQARVAAEPATLRFLDALDNSVKNRFGDDSPDLESFGIAPKKPKRKLTPAQNLAKAEKSRLTREKRKAALAPDSSPPAPAGGAPAPHKQ